MEDEENPHIIKVSDSAENHSRKSLKFFYNPEHDILGKGGYGKVYRVKIEKESPSEIRTYALKIFEKKLIKEDEDIIKHILKEIKIHRNLKHSHICKFEHSFEDKNNIYILMEYCSHGSLFNYLKAREKLEEIEIRFYMFQVLKVLKYFRLQKLVHRDLTLSNIFLKDYKTVKISDFGFAYKENELLEKEEEVCGTPGYYPPESHLSKYSYKTDIFYFGMCIYYLFGGKYMLNTSQQSYDFFLHNVFIPDKKMKLSEEAFYLLRNIITVEGKRIDLEQIYQHPFFNKGKGLDIETFPDYNDANYMDKIKDLTEQFGIKYIDLSLIIDNINLEAKEKQNISIDKNIDIDLKKRNTYDGNISKPNKMKLYKEKNENKYNNKNNKGREEVKNLKNYYNNITKFKTVNLNEVIYVVDFNDKLIKNYGIGYRLNNNNIGFLFNDESQMTKINNEINYVFYHKKDNMTKYIENNIINITSKNISEDILKKIKLVFQMEQEFKKKKIKYVENKILINYITDDVYVKKYKQGFNCITFLLSNKNIQVNFLDGIIILFNHFPKALIYFCNDKKNNISIFPLRPEENFSDINCENFSINNKIKYALGEIKK